MIISSIALSSVNGKSWFGGEMPFPWPDASAPLVTRLVLGSLKDGAAIEINETTLAGLRKIKNYFPGLTHLHLWAITNLEEVDGLPEGLKCLDIRKCPGLRAIGAVSAGLEKLDLAGCPLLEALPAGELRAVSEAWLEGCGRLREFEPLEDAVSSLKTLVLYGCGVKDLTSDLLGERGENVANEVRKHFTAKRKQGTGHLAECKVVVLGNGGVGKTELVRALKGLKYNSGQVSTEGIQLWKWDGDKYEPYPKHGVKEVQLNIWDFGGQDLYHNTHRLFLENKAIFVVVWRQAKKDASGKVIPFRKEHLTDPVRPLNYWLDQVYAVHKINKPRVILVRTGMDEDETNPPEDWKAEVRPEYQNLPVFEVSAAEKKLNGFKEALLEAVKEELGGHKAVEIPKGRLAVRQKLDSWQPSLEEGKKRVDSEKPILPRAEYKTLVHQIFAERDMSAPDEGEIAAQLTLFHNGGAIYFPRHWAAGAGEYPVIVDQRWVIDGIYELIRDGVARDKLVHSRGMVRGDYLDTVWNKVRGADGEPRYDLEAQKVMKQFMLSCGLLVDGGDRYVFPEYLPDWETLVENEAVSDHSPVSTIEEADTADFRQYLMKHRDLGLGFGCLLVGAMVEKFWKKIHVFKYGAVANVKVGNQFTGGERDVLIKIEWFREEAEKHYQGDIILSIFDAQDADRDVVALMQEILQKLSGFPAGLNFTRFDGMDLVWAEPVETRMRARPKKVDAIVGISMAGEDGQKPGIEFWPLLLEEELLSAAEGRFEVLCYTSDKERATVSKLIGDLTNCDLMLAVISKKYLHSEYCMVEFYEAAKYHQEEATFEKPDVWTNRVWPIILPDAVAYLEPGEAKEWTTWWLDRWNDYQEERKVLTQQYGGSLKAGEYLKTTNVCHSWLEFCGQDAMETAKVLAAMQKSRNRRSLPKPPSEGKAKQAIQPLVKRIVEEMEKVIKGLPNKF